MERTVLNRDVGYWCTPAGANGDATVKGDQIWFLGGKNEQNPEDNCVLIIGNVTEVINRDENPDIFDAYANVWGGDWSSRKIVIFRVMPILDKDKLTYKEVCDLFGYKGLKNGSVRVKIV